MSLPRPPVGRARQCPGSFIAAAPTAAAGHRRILRMGSGGVRWERACCPLRSRRVALLAICCRGASSGGRAWRHMPRIVFPGGRRIATCARNALSAVRRRQGAREMHSQAPGGGDMLTLCVPGCLTMAIFYPGVSQKRPRTGKGPLRGNISPSCIQNELALARYARHASEKPCKSPLEDTPREYLARKGPFSLREPLESCTACRSCHDSAFARPCERKARGAGYRKCTSHCGRRPHPMVTYVCGSRARSRQLPLCGRWRKPMTVSAAASEQCSGAYARPVLRHPPVRSVRLANGIRPPAANFAAGASRRSRAQ